jgi:ribonuclease P protein component
MEPPLRYFLPKEERINSKKDLKRLMSSGSYGYAAGMKFCCYAGTGEGCNRILVSVPKRNFKRANRRNLLKRRIREAYRLRKHMLDSLSDKGVDIMFLYTSQEIMSSAEIGESMDVILDKIIKEVGKA